MKLPLILSIAIGWLVPFALPAAEIATPAITITTPDAIKVLKLKAGQPRLYDSDPLRVIEKHSAKLAGWKFTSIPQRIILSYRIHANKDGVIYAFGGGSRFHPPTREEFLGADAAQWVEKPDAIEGLNIPMCFRRKVKAGETIMLQSFELALAAESIALEGASASTLAVADSGATTAIRSPAEVLAKEGPNAIEWALAPLKRAVPTELRQNLTLLREDLLDEAAKKPVASAEA